MDPIRFIPLKQTTGVQKGKSGQVYAYAVPRIVPIDHDLFVQLPRFKMRSAIFV